MDRALRWWQAYRQAREDRPTPGDVADGRGSWTTNKRLPAAGEERLRPLGEEEVWRERDEEVKDGRVGQLDWLFCPKRIDEEVDAWVVGRQ